MDEKQKKQLRWICLTGIIYVLIMIVLHVGPGKALNFFPVNLLLFLIPYIMVGWKVIRKSVIHIRHGQIFDENFLMMVATFGALAIGEYSEAVAVMLFYQVGEFFEDFAVDKSRRSITALMDIAPEFANVERGGKLEQVDPEEVQIGDIFVVRPGERIPLDGVVTEGESMLDTAALTGESVPRSAHVGDEVFSGCVNGSGVLKIRAEKAYEDSTVSRVLDLVENASDRKARTENFVTRFARYYTPVVVFAAVAVAILLPLIGGATWQQGLKSACIFLVVSCPCAFVLSVPLTFFGGIGSASHMGILIKGSNYLEAAAKLKTVVFDKTGTLTKGEFSVTKILPADGVDEEELLAKAASAEQYSTHPVAESIRRAYAERGKTADASQITENRETAGHGVAVVMNGKEICAGNRKLMDAEGISVPDVSEAGTVVYVSEDKKYLGTIVISDIIKPEAKKAIEELHAEGVTNTVMLTGDRREAGEAVAKELGIDTVYTDLLPGDKVSKVEELLAREDKKSRLAFVGDGINDAPVITRADVGFAMGSMGSDAAIEAADIVLMDDDTRKVSKTVKLARRTMRIVYQNIIFALVVKIVVMVMSLFSVANMWEAVFADVGVSVICILNAMRILRTK
ncbi:MAG: heavy metal translocating P-type ATPase [Lachnospiraceae bacterium]|jgi:Cd2+/Zn2+-exporting ATPase